MDKVLICGGHGAGDSILSFIAAHYVGQKIGHENVDVLSFTRDEVFKPLNYLFGDQFKLKQHKDKEKWLENHWILHNTHNTEVKNLLSLYTESSLLLPDLLYRNTVLGFDWEKYRVHPQILRQKRLLEHLRKPEGVIYVGTNTSTKEYFYPNTPELLRRLAKALPDKKIYYNNVTLWNNIKINNGNFSNLPSNVVYFENQDFIDSIKWLEKSEYCICVDNGISWISQQMGIPRLLLDTRLNLAGLIWMARWRADISESIGYNHSVETITKLVKTNIEIPQSCLIPRNICVGQLDSDFSKLLYFKY